MHFLIPNPTYGHGHHGICPLDLAASTGSHVCACSACCHRGLSIMERVFLSCHQSNVPTPPPLRRHKSSAAAGMEHKCGMSLQSCTCVSVLSGDFCSQKTTTLARQYQSRHSATSQPSAPGRLGRKTRARFPCLLVKIGSYSGAVGRIKTPKGISLFDQGVLNQKKLRDLMMQVVKPLLCINGRKILTFQTQHKNTKVGRGELAANFSVVRREGRTSSL